MIIIQPCKKYHRTVVLHLIPSIPDDIAIVTLSENLSNPSNSVKIGTPCLKPLAQLPHEYKTSPSQMGAGLKKLPLRKCLMGVVTPTLYHGCVPLSSDEQGMGRTNG